MRAIIEKLYELQVELDKREEELMDALNNKYGPMDGAVKFDSSDLIKAQAVELECHAKALRELLDVAWEEVG